MTNNEQIKERIVDALDELFDTLDEVTGAEKEKKKPEKIRVFICPFYEECQIGASNQVSWKGENELVAKLTICKAPFLMHRKTGNRICRIEMERDKVENWIEAVNDIGRVRNERDKDKKRVRTVRR